MAGKQGTARLGGRYSTNRLLEGFTIRIPHPPAPLSPRIHLSSTEKMETLPSLTASRTFSHPLSSAAAVLRNSGPREASTIVFANSQASSPSTTGRWGGRKFEFVQSISASVAGSPKDVRQGRAPAPASLPAAAEQATASAAAAADSDRVEQPRGFSAAAEAKLLAVVGRGKRSPWGAASWKEVLEQMGRKLTRSDAEMEMVVLEDADLLKLEPHAAAAFRDADLVVAVNVDGAAAAAHIAREAGHVDTLVALDSHPSLQSRLGGVRVGGPHSHSQRSSSFLQSLLPASVEAERKLQMVKEVWARVSSDNVLVALQLLINNYVAPVPSLQKLQAQGVEFLACALGNCGPQILASLLDPEARAALSCMQECDPTDQFCTYRCIASHENPRLQALSLCLLEKHNCLDLCAAVPMHLAAAPIRTFRGAPVTHRLAEDLLIGWCRDLGHSWKIAGNMFPIASQFRSQTQTFYREAGGRMWYDPVFKVTTGKEGQEIWRRRHYSVARAEEPGTFSFSFLDNGVMTREFWIIVDVADDLSWALFHSVGAAQRTGQTFTGAVVCTPTGAWPANSHLERLYGALDRCGIKDWETVRVDHSSYQGAPRLGPPEHVPLQVFLGEATSSMAQYD